MSEDGHKKEKRDTKKLILDAAIKIIGQKGYHETTIRDIVKESGQAIGTIYNYFKSKEEMMLVAFKEFFEEMLIYNDVQEKAFTSIKDKVDGHIKYLIDYFVKYPAFLRIFVVELNNLYFKGSDEEIEKVIELWDQVYAEVARKLKEGRDKGELYFEGDPSLYPPVLIGAVQGFLKETLMVQGSITPEQLESFTHFIMHGLANRRK